jgi:type II secretory pathway pseudopilin PulG
MKFLFPSKSQDSFTLVELLVVIGILAILTAAVVIVLNPAELLKQSRDSKRTTDLAALNNALKILLTQSPDVNLGTSSTVYVSLADSSSTCGSYALPVLPAGWQYSCVTTSNLTRTDGGGWIPVNFANGASQLPALPLDPQNAPATGLYYTYAARNGQWELTALFESAKYAAKESSDGGADPAGYEVGSNVSLTPFSKGLIGYWSFDEGSGASAGDGSGYGNNGALMTTSSTLPQWVQGKIGNALQFDGASSYVDAGTSQVFSITKTVSISAWIKLSYFKNWAAMLSVGNWLGTSPYYSSYAFQIWGDGSLRTIFNYNVANPIVVNSTTKLLLNTWQFVAVTYDGSSVKLFINGQPAISPVPYSSTVQAKDPSHHAYIGNDPTGSIEYISGMIDDLRIYNRALSDAEVQAIYDMAK